MNRQIVKVLWNRKMTPEVFSLALSVSTGYDALKPGQFIMVRPVAQRSPLLGRPFSIYSQLASNGNVIGIELLIKTIGEGTQRLSELKEGDTAALLGPLGTSFDIPPKATYHCLVAGGIGVAPLVFLAQVMAETGMEGKTCEAFVGGRTSADLVGIDRLTGLGIRVITATEDGSAGHTGRVTDIVKKSFASQKPDMIYTCGPWPMLAAVADLAEKREIPCQVSIETMMGCGMGVCLSCVVPSRDALKPYRHACTQGPVMDTRQIRF